jgi:hypothetical protein
MRAALLLACLLPGVSCVPQHPPKAFETPEDVKEFQDLMQSNVQVLTNYLQKTQQGQNVSEFTLGWLVYNILSTVAGHDQGLYDFFNLRNSDLQIYLRTTFRQAPERQIEALDALRAQQDTPFRATARFALESLRHIPDSHDPPEVQRKDRQDLAEALIQTIDSIALATEQSARPEPEQPSFLR